jgi:hypothetical protein
MFKWLFVFNGNKVILVQKNNKKIKTPFNNSKIINEQKVKIISPLKSQFIKDKTVNLLL